MIWIFIIGWLVIGFLSSFLISWGLEDDWRDLEIRMMIIYSLLAIGALVVGIVFCICRIITASDKIISFLQWKPFQKKVKKRRCKDCRSIRPINNDMDRCAATMGLVYEEMRVDTAKFRREYYRRKWWKVWRPK